MNPITKIIIEDTPMDATNEIKLTTASTIICLIFIYTSIYELAHTTQLPTPKARDMKPGSGV